MCHRSEPLLYPKPFTKVSKILFIKLLPVVKDQYLRDTVSTNELFPKEILYLLGRDAANCLDFNPSCNIIHGNNQVFLPSFGFWERSNEVHSPLSKQDGKGHCGIHSGVCSGCCHVFSISDKPVLFLWCFLTLSTKSIHTT